MTVLLNQYDSYSRNTDETQKNPFRTFKRCRLKTEMHCRVLFSAPTILSFAFKPSPWEDCVFQGQKSLLDNSSIYQTEKAENIVSCSAFGDNRIHPPYSSNHELMGNDYHNAFSA